MISNSMPTPILLTRQQAGSLLNLSVRAIDFLIADGRLPSRKIGRRRLVPHDAVERFAKQDHGRIVPSPIARAGGRR
jgi:excisionase family DNA binding protein